MHILLITRHFPPEVSGGARRPYLLVQALRQAGHKVTLVSPFQETDGSDFFQVPHPACINIENETQTTPEVPDSFPVRNSSWEPIRTLLRQWLLWPDPDIRWCRKAQNHISNLINADELKPDILMTTSPPESLHLIGAHLKKRLQIPWIAEMRDTWVEMPHREILERSAIRATIERRIARSSLKNADGLVTVSEAVLKEAQKYISQSTPTLLIDHFSAPCDETYPLPESDLNLVHTGGFELSDRRRKLHTLLDAISKSAKQRIELSEKNQSIHLHIAGRLLPEEIQLTTKIQDFKITLHGQIPLETSRALQASADGLILHTPENSHALPGKYAEYCQAKRPILYLGGGDWLSLVKVKSNLFPLSSILPNMKKNMNVEHVIGFDSNNAAKQLLTFIDTHIFDTQASQ